MLSFGARSRKRSDMNVTSLIDVVFILLIFFMISSTFDKPAIVVDLPEGSSAEPAERRGVSVSVKADGSVFLDGKAIELGFLAAAIAPLVSGYPDIPVSLYCDASVPFGTVASIVDALKTAGANHVAIRYEQAR